MTRTLFRLGDRVRIVSPGTQHGADRIIVQVSPEWGRPYLMDNGWTFDDSDLDLIARPR